MAAALAGPMSHDVIGGLIAGGLTVGIEELLDGTAPPCPTGNNGGGPTLGGVFVSGVSGGVCGVDADVGVFNGFPPEFDWPCPLCELPLP